MNTLKLILEHRHEVGEYFTEVRLLIDGTDLMDIVTEFETELSRAAGAAVPGGGGYRGLELHRARETLLGASDKYYEYLGVGLTVFVCGCGIKECGALYVRIRDVGGNYLWDRFSALGRDPFDYRGLGLFTFDRDAYVDEVNRVLPGDDRNYEGKNPIPRFQFKRIR